MKKSLFTAFAVGLCITANLMAQVPSYVPTNGLVGWWPFNGNANDESGNGNNGTVNGATLTTDRFGNANKAYSFDGVNDFIEVLDAPNLRCRKITISVWINLQGLFGQVLYKGNLSNAQSEAYSINGTPLFSIKKGSNCIAGDGWQTINVNQSPIQGNWCQITGTYDGNSLKTYYNGELTNSSINIGLIDSCINSNLRFGYNHNFNNNGDPWNGKLDDIGIWNRALTECEIQDLYNSQLNSVVGSTISVSPQSANIGSNVALSTSSQSTNIQWQSNPLNFGWQNVPNNANYSGETTNTLTVSNVQLSNHNQPFRVIASSGNCTDTSNVATIQIADTCITTVYDTLLTTVTDTLVINTTLSLPAPNNENTILIYPNPASDHITIDNGNFAAMAGYTIRIENNAGQQVFQSSINQQQFYVDLSTWSGNGLYFVHLINPQNNTVTVRKIVLQ